MKICWLHILVFSAANALTANWLKAYIGTAYISLYENNNTWTAHHLNIQIMETKETEKKIMDSLIEKVTK